MPVEALLLFWNIKHVKNSFGRSVCGLTITFVFVSSKHLWNKLKKSVFYPNFIKDFSLSKLLL